MDGSELKTIFVVSWCAPLMLRIRACGAVRSPIVLSLMQVGTMGFSADRIDWRIRACWQRTARRKNCIMVGIFNYRIGAVGTERIGDEGLWLPGGGLDENALYGEGVLAHGKSREEILTCMRHGLMRAFG
jgi:hypothetical protein